MVLKNLLVAVQRELLAAHWADFPVAFHVFLKLALVIVGWEDDLTEWTPFHVHAARRRMTAEEKRNGESVHVLKSRHTMMWANKEHLSDAEWVALLTKKRVCAA